MADPSSNIPNNSLFSWSYFFKIARFHGIVLFGSILVSFALQRFYFKEAFNKIFMKHLESEILTEFDAKNFEPYSICQKKDQDNKFWYLINTNKKVLCSSSAVLDKESLEKLDFSAIYNKKVLSLVVVHNESTYFISLKRYGLDRIILHGQKATLLNHFVNEIDRSLWVILIPMFIVMYILLLWSSFRYSEPMKKVLQRVYHLNEMVDKKKLISDEELHFFGDQNEWQNFEKTLSLTEQSLEGQIQAIKQEHKKNKILLESITEGILAVSNNEKILFLNSRFTRKFLKDQTITVDLNLSKVFEGEDEILQAYRECIKNGIATKVKEFKYFHKNRNLYFDIIVNPILDESTNETFGAVGVFHNVTEAKLTEQMRVDFVANVSHEIRTPLTSIKGFSQVLKAQPDLSNEKRGDYIEKIIKNTERLHSLFNDLLNLSLIESKHKLKKEEINLKKMIESVQSMLLQNYSHKNIKIHYDLPVETILADNKLFEQALINLIDNACKYAGEEPDIKISNFVDGNKLIITVSDKGPGISREHLGRVFERFYRVDSARSNNKTKLKGGTGLGLSIVKHIINKHKGTIWVESEKNQGTIFFIEIPHYS